MVSTSHYIEAPRRLRAFVRAHETSLVVLAALIGTIGGLVVAAMSAAVQGMHALLFNLDLGDRLSSQYKIDPLRALLVPGLGGLVLGVDMNGPAVKIEGNQWLSQAAAQAKGLSVTGALTWSGSYAAPFLPAVPDTDTATMLQSAVQSGASANGQGFRVTQNLPNGTYQVYLWMGEPYRDHHRDVNVLLNGNQVATGIVNFIVSQDRSDIKTIGNGRDFFGRAITPCQSQCITGDLQIIFLAALNVGLYIGK